MSDRCPTCHRTLPKPLPKRRVKPRRVSVNRDPGYRRWLQTESCILVDEPDCLGVAVTVRDGRLQSLACCDAAHTQNNGLSSKGPDSSCVPLCRAHHREYDAGRAAFEKKYDVNMKKLAAEHYARYLKEMKNDDH